MTHKSRTDRRTVFKLGSNVGHVTRHTQQLFKVKRPEVKVTKSRDVSADKNAITRQCMVISTSNLKNVAKSPKFCTLIGNRGRRIERRCLNLHLKYINNRFCACAVQILLTVAANATKCSTFEVQSHTRTVVRECCKGDDESQWERVKFDPQPPKNPLTDGHQNLRT